MSVISTLRDRATTTPSDEAFVFMDYDTKTGDQIDRMTWSQLYSRVTAVSAYLISYGRHADRRRTAAISAPQGLDYVAGFLGALCAGWTPVPLPEPLGSLRDKRTGLAVLDCAADVVLTTSQAETRVRATSWVDWFNHRRLYQYCGDVPPVELEAAYYAQRQRPAAG